MEQILLWIGTYTVFAGTTVPFIIELLFKYWQPNSKLLSRVISMIVALICAFAVWGIGMLFGVGFLVGASVYAVIGYGLGAGLIANFSWIKIEWIKELITRILGTRKNKFKNFKVRAELLNNKK